MLPFPWSMRIRLMSDKETESHRAQREISKEKKIKERKERTCFLCHDFSGKEIGKQGKKRGSISRQNVFSSTEKKRTKTKQEAGIKMKTIKRNLENHSLSDRIQQKQISCISCDPFIVTRIE